MFSVQGFCYNALAVLMFLWALHDPKLNGTLTLLEQNHTKEMNLEIVILTSVTGRCHQEWKIIDFPE